MIYRHSWALLALALVPNASAIERLTRWNNKEEATWLAAQRHLDTAYLVNSEEY